MIKQDGTMFRVFDASGRDTGKYGMSMEKALQIEAKLGIKSGGSTPAPRRQKAPEPAPSARFVDGDEVYPALRRQKPAHPQASVGLRLSNEYAPSASVRTAFENARVSVGAAKAETAPAEQLRRYTEANRHIRAVERLLLEDFLSSLDALPAAQRKLEDKAQDSNKKTAFNASFFELKRRIENLAESLND